MGAHPWPSTPKRLPTPALSIQALDFCVCKITGDDAKGKKSGSPSQQLSPFHKITIPHCTDIGQHTSSVDSPRSVAPKIQKAAMNTIKTDNCNVPARRGRRAKNGGKKKTSETTISSNLESGGNANNDADGKIFKETSGKLLSDCDSAVMGKRDPDLLNGGAVDGNKSSDAGTAETEETVSSKIDAASDVEQKQKPSRVTVKGRRCTSVPAGHSRYAQNAAT